MFTRIGSHPWSLIAAAITFALPLPSISDDRIDSHVIRSQYQSGETNIRVLLPDGLDETRSCRVLYVLPVEAGEEDRYGNGLTEVLKCDLHNKHQLICVFPTFSHLPWYADHPTDETIRQESYLLKDVLPLVERTYPVVKEPDGRMLVGFSKSGWGAWSLLLRHPDVFGKAAAWDAPLMMDTPGKYGSGPIFGTAQNFDRYQLPIALRERGVPLGKQSRLILTGYDAFREQHVSMHQLLTERQIPHVYRDGPFRKHTWHSGWLEEAVELLIDN